MGRLLILLVLTGCGGGTAISDAGIDSGPPAADAGRDGGNDAGTDAGLPDAGAVDGGCTTDADGDGHRSLACGGDDCDDADPDAYPGNAETCDAANHDDDCNPATFGALDADGDTYASSACCNAETGGAMHCGPDCDDADPNTHPTAPEVCDGIDNDCSGTIDVGLPTFVYYPDCDADGHGATSGMVTACGVPTMAPASCATGGWVMSHDDCDDMRAAVYPGAIEHCNGHDDDCNGMTEMDGDGDGHYPPGSCVTSVGDAPNDDCRDDLAAVHPSADYTALGICAPGAIPCLTTESTTANLHVDCWAAIATCDPLAFCLATTGSCPPRATFDYDCNGVIDREPAATLSCIGAACGGGAYHYTGTPECGLEVSHSSCRRVGTIGCTTDTGMLPLPCR